MDGPRTMWNGFGRSVNTYFCLAGGAGRRGSGGGDGRAARHRVPGRRRRKPGPLRRPGVGPFTLGVASTTPLDLANAYATVAAEGTYCAPCRSPRSPTAPAVRSPRPRRTAAGSSTSTWPGRRRTRLLPGRRPVGVRAL
jgi:hypothetical protein